MGGYGYVPDAAVLPGAMPVSATPGAHTSLPSRVRLRLRVARNISVRVHPLHVPLLHIRRKELRHHWIIVPGIIVIEPAHRVVELARIALIGTPRTLHVALAAVGTVDLLAQHCADTQRRRGTVGGKFVPYMVITALFIQAAAVHTTSHHPHSHK